MPHDGPATRDSWKFSFLRTFLANRGYAVLQMNYRGSAGFGLKWLLDAHQDWGGLIYSDIQDATRWAVSEGIADPKRICIMGWGFGGYAALLGAARNGDTYRCAVSIAGIADLEMYQEHGAISGDEEYPPRADRRRSGESEAQLAGGTRRADQHSRDADSRHQGLAGPGGPDQRHGAGRSRRQKKPYEEVIIKNGSHELERKSDRMTLLKEVEAFLNTHLGPGSTS